MTTFSQLVDALAIELARPDLVTTIATYLQQTIRECHLDPDKNTPVFLHANYAEAQVIATQETGQFWLIPDLARWQGLQKVRFDSVSRDGYTVYALPLTHNRTAEQLDYAYQQAGDRVFFKGYGGLNGVISLAYYQYPKRLIYRPLAARPASYNEDTGLYTYLPEFSATPELQESARDLTINWLLLRWREALEEGVRAKVYKRLGDESRARLAYSAYMQIRMGLINTELADLGGSR